MRVPSGGRWLLLAGGILASAALLECGARTLDRIRGRPWTAERSGAATREWCDALALANAGEARTGRRGAAPEELKILQPYTAWELSSAQTRSVLDLESYRRAGENVFHVCILGGAAARDFADTASARLAGALARDPRLRGREVRVHDYAVCGYKQPQMSMLLGWLFAIGHRPDAVVEIDDVLEADLARRNALAGTHPSYPSVASWTEAMGGMLPDWETVERVHEVRERRARAIAFGTWFLDSSLGRSCFLDHLASLRMRALDRRCREAALRLEDYRHARRDTPELHGPAFSAAESAVEEEIVAGWERASKSMSGMCSAESVAFVQVLRANAVATGQADGEASAALGQLSLRLREAGRKLASGGSRVLESEAVPGGHPSGADAALADAIAGALLEAFRP